VPHERRSEACFQCAFREAPGRGRAAIPACTAEPAGLGDSECERRHPGRRTTVCDRGRRRRVLVARDVWTKCRVCRREGMKLFLKGERCLTRSARSSAARIRRVSTARPHQAERVPAPAAREAKARRYYGLLEKQFRNYYEKASRRSGVHRRGAAADAETRLGDNLGYVVYRLGFAASARQAPRSARAPRPLHGERPPRELPSYQVRPGRDHHGSRRTRRRSR